MASVAAHSAGGRAVVRRRYGPPDVLVYEELVLPDGVLEAVGGELFGPSVRTLPARRALPLSDAASARAMLERGGGRDRILLVPSSAAVGRSEEEVCDARRRGLAGGAARGMA